MTKNQASMYKIDDVKLKNKFNKKISQTLDDTSQVSMSDSENEKANISIDTALNIILRQMKTDGIRERTLNDYTRYLLDFKAKSGCYYVSEISLAKIYDWFDTMNVKNSTKKIRYKSLSAVLTRFFDNGWIQNKFWKSIKIRVDEEIKQPTKKEDIELLLSILDFSNFFELRDACAVLMMWQTGIRIRTLSYLNECDIDFKNKVMLLNGEIMKNHKMSKMPLSDDLLDMLEVLIRQNKIIRERNNKQNQLLFLTQRGDNIQKYHNTNAIRKKLQKYAEDYNLKNINPHSIRRGYALNLLKKGASIALISKALSHSDIAVTTKYLYLDTEETLAELRNYL